MAVNFTALLRLVGSLVLSIIIDLIGYLTYIVPVLGEFGDLVWAPISAYLIFKLHGGRVGGERNRDTSLNSENNNSINEESDRSSQMTGLAMAAFGFIEEIMPGMDFIPSATICWALSNFGLFRTLGLWDHLNSGYRDKKE